DNLKPTSLNVSGTQSSTANSQLKRYFGNSAPFVVLLRGPSAQLERQGPALVHAMRRDPKVTTISPWDKGSVARLRPGPNRALILVDFHTSIDAAVNETVPHLNHLLETKVKQPVEAKQTGFATLSRAIQDESISASERSELIALPVLLVVLLLVFRSPIAALIPLTFGAITVITSRGVLTFAAHYLSIDAFALTVSTMMGLALGVDYALLMVSRFREELERGVDPYEAARTTRRTAGRTTVFAGSTLFLAMAVSIFILPGALLASLAGTVIIVVLISVTVATVVAPPLLALVGTRIDRWRIGAPPGGRSRLMDVVNTCLRRPILATVLIGGIVLLLVTPAIGLKTGPPSIEQLPSSSQPRKEAEEIDAEIGPGFEAPFILVASTPTGTITEEPHLAEVTHWQQEIAKDPGVQAVIGPAQVSKKVKPLRKSSKELVDPGPGGGKLGELTRLGPKLAQAERGVAQVRSGLLDAAAGAGLLGEGSGHAEQGAAAIAAGLQKAGAGGERALTAIDQLVSGSGELASGQGEAKAGALSLKLGLTHLLKALRPGALGRARSLRARLNKAAAEDPSLEPAAKEASALVEHLAVNRNEIRVLRGESQRLHGGESKLVAGSTALHEGTRKLSSGAAELPSGLAKLQTGAERLVTGLAQLQGGAGSLEENLSEGSRRSYPLQTGLHHASVKVTAGAGDLNDRVDRLNHQSPGLFDSGYFVLSAIDGAHPGERRSAASAIDVERGGQAAAVLVIPHYTFNTPGSIALYERLKSDADKLSASSGLTVSVAGGAAQLTDYNDVVSESLPILIAAITLVTFLMMVVILRALPLAALAVLLNLSTVGVAFGVLTLLFNVPAGYPLGGNTYVDAVGTTMIFGVIFGLSIDYAVFLLMRMRESHEKDGDNVRAISFGLEKTARIITGAAAIMMAVFIVFASAPLATVSQLGVGLTVAVILDATVIRIVLLPALMLLIGDRIWWLPRSLDRLLPEIDLHGEEPVTEVG
ncbi:MAG TPA: MMPL family transporter, partial [Solirubrobacterales bacterium]|nr:MMPL family transporter [Solirubrobacterales bacterium]